MLGRKIVTSGDFNLLIEKVWCRTRTRLSPTTTKRLWGYLHEEVQPRPATLDALARFVGYRDYEAFTCAGKDIESNPIFSRHITDKDIAIGQHLCLMWKPGRRIVARHDGEGNFTIVESEKSKLHVGDTFTCRLVIEREPLYINNVVHDNEQAACYIAGRDGGIIFEVL